jgi:hypothetical protein
LVSPAAFAADRQAACKTVGIERRLARQPHMHRAVLMQHPARKRTPLALAPMSPATLHFLQQTLTDAKSNEITAVPQLLKLLSLKGTIVTVDALNCQRAIAQQIIDQGGDYAFALKGNQGTLHSLDSHGQAGAEIFGLDSSSSAN